MVGTAIGLDGLNLVDRVHAHIADDPVLMAESIIELLTDDGHAGAVARSARELVEEEYEWSVIADELARRLVAMAP